MTERECALTKDAEIIWDLSELRWVCCMPEDEDFETCIPITDMKRLPQTSLKPLPPKGTQRDNGDVVERLTYMMVYVG